MRDLKDVLKELKAECQDENMLWLFEKAETDISYTAPEAMYIRWDQVSEIIFTYHDSYINEAWYRKLLSIWTTKPIEEINAFLDKGEIV